MGDVTFTLDLEDHRPHHGVPARYPDATRRVLAFLDERAIRGTFFVIASLTEEHPDLVRDIADAGHEIALHGWRHEPIGDVDEATWRDQIGRARDVLQQLTGTPVVGYRAPTFSLIADTVWATEVLHDLGFTYSSSVLPARNPLYGYPGAPREPFLWPSGLAEFPVPISGFGRIAVPYLGGTYLRVIPGRVGRTLHARRAATTPWTYLHPYDIDEGEPFWWVPDAGSLSPLLWVGRSRVLAKLDALFADGAAPPLGERIADARRGGTYHPEPMIERTRTAAIAAISGGPA